MERICGFFFKFIYFFLIVIHFIHISVYMSIPIAQFSTPSSPPNCSFPSLVSIHLFSTSVSQLLPCKPVHLYHFSRFHIYVESRKMVQMILFAKQKQRHRRREQRYGYHRGKGGGNWEIGIDINTLLILCIKQTTNENLLYSTGNYIQYLIINYNGKESKKYRYTYVCITESLCCTPETNTIL